MLWPVVLPFQITCVVLLVAIVVLTVFASPKTRSRIGAFYFFSLVSLVAFIPCCTGIMAAVDAVRFGDFNYASFSDIPDFRSQRYLPEKATHIEMRKHANGYLARYRLPADDFKVYLDELWERYGEYSAVERGGFSDEGQPVDPEGFRMTFGDLGWDCPAGSIVYYSPSEGDGGGATYYVAPGSDVMFQRTSFW